MEKLPDNLSEEDFMKLAELHKKYEESKELVIYHKTINDTVEIVIPLVNKMKERLKEVNDFKPE